MEEELQLVVAELEDQWLEELLIHPFQPQEELQLKAAKQT